MYYCLRCGKKCKTKSNLNQHLRRKKQCEKIYLNLSRNVIITDYENYEKDFLNVKNEMMEGKNIKEHKKNTNEYNDNIKEHKDITNINQIICEYCEKNFSYKTSYYRHKKHRCVIIKKNEQEKNELIDKLLDEKYNSLKSKLEKKMEKTIVKELESTRLNLLFNDRL